MSKTILLQNSHSRNSHDWTMVKTANGRHAFLANKQGVAKRIGLLVNFIGENPGTSAREMTSYLEGIHASYTINDVAQPVKQMLKLGMVRAKGKTRAATYTLTPNGRAIWKSVTKKYSGKK